MRDWPPAGYTPRSTARYGGGVAVARSVTWSDRNRSLEGSGEYTQRWVALSHRSAPMPRATVMENRRAVILPRNASSATAAMTARATALLSAPHAICASVARAAAARAPARATATDPNTPVTPSSAMAPATTTHGTSAFADRKSTRLNSSHLVISYAVFCLKKKKNNQIILTY